MLDTKTPTAPLFRLGRKPDLLSPPDWSRAQPDGTFANRFDDPQGNYRVLYAATQRVSCFVETLARFRPNTSLIAELQAIAGQDDQVPLGTFDLRKAATEDSKRADLTEPISWHGTQRHLVVLPGNRLQFSD